MREAIRVPGMRRIVGVGLVVLIVLGAVSAPRTHRLRSSGTDG